MPICHNGHTNRRRSRRELGRLTLEEALGLLFLYAEKEPIKFERAPLACQVPDRGEGGLAA